MKRRSSMVASTVAVVLAWATGACSSDQPGSASASACATAPSTATGQTTSAATGVGGGGIRVVESGFTQLGPNKSVASIGAVLENTSADQVAYRTRITFRVLGDGGKSTVPAGSGELLRQEIPVILPKQKIPVGAWTYVESSIVAVTVDLGDATWLKRTAAFAEITTSYQSLSRTSSDPETGTVAYSVTSSYCQDLKPRGAGMVFRNSSGTIVGGSFELDLGGEKCPAGVSTQRATADRSVPAGIDVAKTQAYSLCDFAPAPPQTSGGPVN